MVITRKGGFYPMGSTLNYMDRRYHDSTVRSRATNKKTSLKNGSNCPQMMLKTDKCKHAPGTF